MANQQSLWRALKKKPQIFTPKCTHRSPSGFLSSGLRLVQGNSISLQLHKGSDWRLRVNITALSTLFQHEESVFILEKRKYTSFHTYSQNFLIAFKIIFCYDDDFQFFKLLHGHCLLGGISMPISWKNMTTSSQIWKKKKYYIVLPE